MVRFGVLFLLFQAFPAFAQGTQAIDLLETIEALRASIMAEHEVHQNTLARIAASTVEQYQATLGAVEAMEAIINQQDIENSRLKSKIANLQEQLKGVQERATMKEGATAIGNRPIF